MTRAVVALVWQFGSSVSGIVAAGLRYTFGLLVFGHFAFSLDYWRHCPYLRYVDQRIGKKFGTEWVEVA